MSILFVPSLFSCQEKTKPPSRDNHRKAAYPRTQHHVRSGSE